MRPYHALGLACTSWKCTERACFRMYPMVVDGKGNIAANCVSRTTKMATTSLGPRWSYTKQESGSRKARLSASRTLRSAEGSLSFPSSS
ncbi:hypothetical protein F3Y22_tig00020022pilonHSYRG00014 [Hibiscus syriacus]|uniref:Uncharacterized protein n=1 Tax=Hibiscus syriacus TaxID=106335 RepID=A0A6A3BY59_HIBSY|nr:hypothetical protein F3Y22_tig00020022pilonHSYRG00014 [Hibiscus syriacus]